MPPSRRAAKATDSAPASVSKGSTRKRASSSAATTSPDAEDSVVKTPAKSPKQHKRASSSVSKAASAAANAKDEATRTVTKSTKKVLELAKDEASSAASVSTSSRAARLPAWSHFPLLSLLSFSMASLGYSLLGAVTKGELAAVSRSQDTWGEVAVLATWRLIELAIGWFGDLDTFDVAAMDLLSHGPSLYLLSAFYGLSPSTARFSFIVDIASAALPFYLLRGLSAIHIPSAKVYNRELISWLMQLYTGALATAIYTVVVVLSLRFVLPRALVLYFSGIPSLSPAYDASYLSVLPMTIQFGAAASLLLYAPFATTARAAEDERINEFDPAAATLGETVAWNFLGYTAKTKVIVRRTAVAVFVTAVNTYLALTMTIYGIEAKGAASYASVWAAATLLSGLGLAFVGGN